MSNWFTWRSNGWWAESLWSAAKDLPVEIVPVASFDSRPWRGYTHEDWERVDAAALSYPIILTPSGVIADGYHRLTKAVMLGKESILVTRLVAMPKPDFLRGHEHEKGCEELLDVPVSDV